MWASGPNFKSCLYFWKFRITPCFMCGPVGQTFLIPTNFVKIQNCLQFIFVWIMFDWERMLMCRPVGQWCQTLLIPPIFLQKNATYFEKILICGSVGQTLKCSFFGSIRIPSFVMCGPVGQTYLKPTYLPDTKLVSSHSCMPNVWIGENINVWASFHI